MDWKREIVELHEFFEAYFLGRIDSMDRFEATLDPDFTMIGPTGEFSTRDEVIDAVRAGHAHTDSLSISIVDAELLSHRNDILVARYVETHELSDRSNHRITTVVFAEDPEAPRGVRWLHAHETWLDRGLD